ncbi:MAG: hypothetical protein V8S14_04375 [Lachnospiraceae bacterium]
MKKGWILLLVSVITGFIGILLMSIIDPKTDVLTGVGYIADFTPSIVYLGNHMK